MLVGDPLCTLPWSPYITLIPLHYLGPPYITLVPLHYLGPPTLPWSPYITLVPLHYLGPPTLPWSPYITLVPLHYPGPPTLPWSPYITLVPLHYLGPPTLPWSPYITPYITGGFGVDILDGIEMDHIHLDTQVGITLGADAGTPKATGYLISTSPCGGLPLEFWGYQKPYSECSMFKASALPLTTGVPTSL